MNNVSGFRGARQNSPSPERGSGSATQVQRQTLDGAPVDQVFHPAPVQIRPHDHTPVLRPVHLAGTQVPERDHRHCRERRFPFPEPQPQRGEPKIAACRSQ